MRCAFVRHRAHRGLGLACLNADRRNAGLRQSRMQPARQRASLKADPAPFSSRTPGRRQPVPQVSLVARASRTIFPALSTTSDRCLFQRHVQPGKVTHGCFSSRSVVDALGPRLSSREGRPQDHRGRPQSPHLSVFPDETSRAFSAAKPPCGKGVRPRGRTGLSGRNQRDSGRSRRVRRPRRSPVVPLGYAGRDRGYCCSAPSCPDHHSQPK